MNKRTLLFLLISLSTFSIGTNALEELQYQQKKMPDGSTEMTYSEADGTSIKQVQRSDGTIITHSYDKDGNETVTTQYPNGKTEVKRMSD